MRELESRERTLKDGQEALRSDKADFENRVQSKAQEIEQNIVADYEAQKAQLIEQQQAVEAERQEWLSTEKEKIDTEVTRQVTEHKAEHDRLHDKREKELESHWRTRNVALITKYRAISGFTITVCLISGLVAIISSVIAFVHGLLPFIIADGKEIGSWIYNDCNTIFGKAFVFPQSLLPILQLALPLIFLIVVGIWTALDFEERKWVVFANEVSIIIIGTGVGISTVFGKQLSEIGFNTVMFPITVYLLYVLIRWLWEIEVIQGLYNGINWLITTLIEKWKDLDTNEKVGNGIITFIIVGAIVMVLHWVKG